MTAAAVVYRTYDDGGRLLYIGSTNHWTRRLADHRKSSEWFPHMASHTVEPHSTLKEARAAEAAAIRTEGPIFNVVGATHDRVRPHSDVYPDQAAIDLAAHIRTVVDAAPPLTVEQRDRLAVLLAPGRASNVA